MKKKRGVGRPRLADNPNLVPRKPKDLPDLEEVTAIYEPMLKKVCHDIKKNFFRQIHIHEFDSEIRQTVMLVYYEMWNSYKAGAIDQFPPYAGYLYITAWRLFIDMWAPKTDLCRYTYVGSYDTIEIPFSPSFTGNMIIIDPLYKEVASQEQIIPFHEHRDDEDVIFGQIPDLLDFWYLGFSINELGVIYNVHPGTIRQRLHTFYDAIEANKGKVFRPRPHRRKRRKNRFKLKKTRSTNPL